MMEIPDADVGWVKQLLYAYTSKIAAEHYNRCVNWVGHKVQDHYDQDDVLKVTPEWARIDNGPAWNPANDPHLSGYQAKP